MTEVRHKTLLDLQPSGGKNNHIFYWKDKHTHKWKLSADGESGEVS